MGREGAGVYRCRRVGKKNTKRRNKDVYQQKQWQPRGFRIRFCVFSRWDGEPFFFPKNHLEETCRFWRTHVFFQNHLDFDLSKSEIFT